MVLILYHNLISYMSFFNTLNFLIRPTHCYKYFNKNKEVVYKYLVDQQSLIRSFVNISSVLRTGVLSYIFTPIFGLYSYVY